MVTDKPGQIRSEHPLGERIAVYKPTAATIVAGFILSALLWAATAAAFFFPLRGAYDRNWQLPMEFAKRGWSWPVVGLSALMGVGLAGGAVFLAYYTWTLISRRVEVFTNGFVYATRRSVASVAWSDVRSIEETILYERPPILKGAAKLLLPEIASRFYRVVADSGEEFRFDGDSVSPIAEFEKLLREQSKNRSIPWETLEKYA